MKYQRIKIGPEEGCRYGWLMPDKPCKLKYRPMLGYDKLTILRGDFVVFNAQDGCGLGRFLGMVKPCSAIQGEKEEPGEYLAVLILSRNGAHAYVHWLEPDDIEECWSARGATDKFGAWFFSNAPLTEDGAHIMRQAKAGSLTVDYFANRDRHK